MFDDNNNQTDQAVTGAPSITPAYPTSTPAPMPVPENLASTPSTDPSNSINFPTTMAFNAPADTPQPTMMSQQAYADTTSPSTAPVANDTPQVDTAFSSPDMSMPELPIASEESNETFGDDKPEIADDQSSEKQDSDDKPADDLLSIKQNALQQLSPLIGKLEQNAEEKFRTTMMMIQASDDQSLIKAAYESAQAIEDEKVKAQALLDIINEINYFTQQHES